MFGLPYRGVLADLDDTLAKTHLIKWAHHKRVAGEFYDIDLTEEELRKHWGIPLQQLIPILYRESDTFENMLAANRSLEHLFPKELQEGALELVDSLLAANIPVGVVTATLRIFAEADLLRLGFRIEEFFLVQTSDDTPVHKPNPAVFDPALAKLAALGIAK